MTVLIVDDDSFTLDVLEHALNQMGHKAVRSTSGKEALEKLGREDFRVVITDWDMPRMSGPELCRAIRNDETRGYIYIIMLSGRGDSKSRREGRAAGADDFLFKPLVTDDLSVCFSTADRILALETRDVALFAMAKLAESRDPDTGAHVERVQTYAKLLARNLAASVRELHRINPDYIRMLYQTSALHDLGKVAIPDSILLKPGKLTRDEFEVMKTHATLGAHTLDAALQRYPNAIFLRMARDIAAYHHERFDGSGYPSCLAGEQIPICARIVALADVYDALTSRRVYKDAIPHEMARQFIVAARGRAFDPDVVDAFLKAEPEFITVRQTIAETSAPAAHDLTSAVPEHRDPMILIVEDSPMLLRSLANLLAETGRTIITAIDVGDGVKCFSEKLPDVVISDWEMPGGTGVDLCRQIRQHPDGAKVHFIMLTARSDASSLLQAYAAGVDDFVANPCNPQELLARVRVGLRAVQMRHELASKSEHLAAVNSQLKVMNARLDRLSITDELTGLFNRRHAMVRLEEQWLLARRTHTDLAVAAIDIDFFKRINDTYGHEGGDTILRQVSAILRDSTRGSDILCRIGGEEFLIIFPLQGAKEVLPCVERVRRNVAEHTFKYLEFSLRATISMGVACSKASMNSFSELLRAADNALYEAKHQGRNRVLIQEDEVTAEDTSSTVTNPGPAEPPTGSRIINMDAIIDRCGGDPDFARNIIERFRQQAGKELNQIDQALATSDSETLRRGAHTMKSMSAYIDASVASELCRQLESLAEANDLTAAAAVVDSLHHEIDCVMEWIDAHPPSPRPLAA